MSHLLQTNRTILSVRVRVYVLVRTVVKDENNTKASQSVSRSRTPKRSRVGKANSEIILREGRREGERNNMKPLAHLFRLSKAAGVGRGVLVLPQGKRDGSLLDRPIHRSTDGDGASYQSINRTGRPVKRRRRKQRSQTEVTASSWVINPFPLMIGYHKYQY